MGHPLRVRSPQVMASDVWTPYEAHPGKGKGKEPPHSVVPEPSGAGLIVVGAAVLLVLGVRLFSPRTKLVSSSS